VAFRNRQQRRTKTVNQKCRDEIYLAHHKNKWADKRKKQHILDDLKIESVLTLILKYKNKFAKVTTRRDSSKFSEQYFLIYS
jgi:hypothetical protein